MQQWPPLFVALVYLLGADASFVNAMSSRAAKRQRALPKLTVMADEKDIGEHHGSKRETAAPAFFFW